MKETDRQTKTEHKKSVAYRLSIALLFVKITQILLEKAICPPKKQTKKNPTVFAAFLANRNGSISNADERNVSSAVAWRVWGSTLNVGLLTLENLFTPCLSPPSACLQVLMLYLKRISQPVILE